MILKLYFSNDCARKLLLTDSLNLPIWLRMVVCTFPVLRGRILLRVGSTLCAAVSWLILESTQGRHLMEMLWTSYSSSFSNSRYLSSSLDCCKSSPLKCLKMVLNYLAISWRTSKLKSWLIIVTFYAQPIGN